MNADASCSEKRHWCLFDLPLEMMEEIVYRVSTIEALGRVRQTCRTFRKRLCVVAWMVYNLDVEAAMTLWVVARDRVQCQLGLLTTACSLLFLKRVVADRKVGRHSGYLAMRATAEELAWRLFLVIEPSARTFEDSLPSPPGAGGEEDAIVALQFLFDFDILQDYRSKFVRGIRVSRRTFCLLTQRLGMNARDMREFVVRADADTPHAQKQRYFMFLSRDMLDYFYQHPPRLDDHDDIANQHLLFEQTCLGLAYKHYVLRQHQKIDFRLLAAIVYHNNSQHIFDELARMTGRPASDIASLRNLYFMSLLRAKQYDDAVRLMPRCARRSLARDILSWLIAGISVFASDSVPIARLLDAVVGLFRRVFRSGKLKYTIANNVEAKVFFQTYSSPRVNYLTPLGYIVHRLYGAEYVRETVSVDTDVQCYLWNVVPTTDEYEYIATFYARLTHDQLLAVRPQAWREHLYQRYLAEWLSRSSSAFPVLFEPCNPQARGWVDLQTYLQAFGVYESNRLLEDNVLWREFVSHCRQTQYIGYDPAAFWHLPQLVFLYVEISAMSGSHVPRLPFSYYIDAKLVYRCYESDCPRSSMVGAVIHDAALMHICRQNMFAEDLRSRSLLSQMRNDYYGISKDVYYAMDPAPESLWPSLHPVMLYLRACSFLGQQKATYLMPRIEQRLYYACAYNIGFHAKHNSTHASDFDAICAVLQQMQGRISDSIALSVCRAMTISQVCVAVCRLPWLTTLFIHAYRSDTMVSRDDALRLWVLVDAAQRFRLHDALRHLGFVLCTHVSRPDNCAHLSVLQDAIQHSLHAF